MHGMFHMATASLRQIGRSILELKNNMQLALKGHLSMTLIDPEQLLAVIKNVKRKIPVQYSLPYSLKAWPALQIHTCPGN